MQKLIALVLWQPGTSTYSESTALPPEHVLCVEKQTVLCKTWMLINTGYRRAPSTCACPTVHTFVNIS